MLRPVCRCKIHHAVVTDASLDYVGSMTIPEDLMRKLNIIEGEQVQVANVSNGERWTTYAIPGKKAGGFSLNGAAARLGCIGDQLIIMCFCMLEEKDLAGYRMKVAFMDEKNKIARMQE